MWSRQSIHGRAVGSPVDGRNGSDATAEVPVASAYELRRPRPAGCRSDAAKKGPSGGVATAAGSASDGAAME